MNYERRLVMATEIPIRDEALLIFGVSNESRDACQLVMGAGFPCEFVGGMDEDRPELMVGHVIYAGLSEIRGYTGRRQVAQPNKVLAQ